MRIKVLLSLLTGAGLLLASASSYALLIITSDSIDGDSCTADTCWTSDDNSQPNADTIADLIGTDTDLTMLYKAEFEGADEGIFADAYDTIFDNTAEDPSDALIHWLEGASITCPECYLSVKDGKQSPALYVFDISSWDGEEDIYVQGFWPGDGGAISNVAIWGASSSVPEPASIALMGLGLLGMGVVARRRKQS